MGLAEDTIETTHMASKDHRVGIGGPGTHIYCLFQSGGTLDHNSKCQLRNPIAKNKSLCLILSLTTKALFMLALRGRGGKMLYHLMCPAIETVKEGFAQPW